MSLPAATITRAAPPRASIAPVIRPIAAGFTHDRAVAGVTAAVRRVTINLPQVRGAVRLALLDAVVRQSTPILGFLSKLALTGDVARTFMVTANVAANPLTGQLAESFRVRATVTVDAAGNVTISAYLVTDTGARLVNDQGRAFVTN